MRWSLLAVRAGIAVISTFVVAMVILSIMPLASGGLEVEVPDSDDGGDSIEPSYQDGVITVSIPLDISNGGFFAIQDLRLHMTVGKDGRTIVESSSVPTTIAAGADQRVVLTMTIDLSRMSQEDWERLVFESADLERNITVEAGYALGLASASLRIAGEMEWEPLVGDFQVNTDAAQFCQEGPDINIRVPFSFQASSMIQGSTVEVNATLSNATSELSCSDMSITLPEGRYQGMLSFIIDGTTAQELMANPGQQLTVGLDMTFAGMTLHREYQIYWGGISG